MSGTGHAALIVASSREDRRVLFDVLDAQSFEAVYSATDLEQARSFFEDDPTIGLIVLEFGRDTAAAMAFCEHVHARDTQAKLPIIGLLGGRGVMRPTQSTGPDVVGWIASPVRTEDALARIKGALSFLAKRLQSPVAVPAQDRYQWAFDGSVDELVVVDPASGRVLEVNDTFLQRSGYTRPQVLERSIHQLDVLCSAQQRAALQQQLRDSDVVQVRARKPNAAGGAYPVDMHVRSAVQDGRLVHLYCFREIVELSRHLGALAALADLAKPRPGEDAINSAVRTLVDWLALDFAVVAEAVDEPEGPVQALAVYHRFAPADNSPDPLQQGTFKAVLGGAESIQRKEAWRHCGDDAFISGAGFECVIGLPLLGERQDRLGALLMARRTSLEDEQVTLDGLRVLAHVVARELELRRAREQGRAIGLRDPLTGMPNRLLFNDRLNSAILEAQRTSEMFAVVFVDLDRFKNINDSLGHTVGDQVLLAVAKRLSGSVRASDTVARYAGDEFTLILRHIVQREDVSRIAEKVVRALEVPLQLSAGLELSITASLGISFYPDDATDPERLLKHADVAMYSAKGMGRNNYQTYVAVPEESHQQRLALEARLRQAEKNDQLRVFYQPQVDAVSEDIVGMEALIRWEHPELGMISPGFFIPLAEESGLIVAIGEWILRAACEDAQRWQRQYGLSLRIGVNLSPLQLRQPHFVDLVASVLESTGLDPRLLDLEITESMNMKSIPNLIETLHALRELGCGISIDDFGTGQSSLDYIKRFPADRIKIDQSFVRNIGIDPDDEAIVQATISMAHNLNREVVAEGVEIEEHLDFLRRHGCEVLQGFLFCRPMSTASFDNLLQERARLLGQVPVSPIKHG